MRAGIYGMASTFFVLGLAAEADQCGVAKPAHADATMQENVQAIQRCYDLGGVPIIGVDAWGTTKETEYRVLRDCRFPCDQRAPTPPPAVEKEKK